MPDATKALASITRKPREQIHQSFMRMVGICQMQAMFRYKLGIRRPPSAYLHVGTAVDRSITADLQHKIDTHELMKRSDVIDLAASTFEERDSAEPFNLDPDEKEQKISREQIKSENKDKTVDLAGLHYDKAAPLIQPSHVARKFAINMDSWLRRRAKQLHDDGDRESDADAAKILHSEAAAMNSAARIGIDFAGEIDVQEMYDGYLLDEPLGTKIVNVRDSKTSGKSPSDDSAEDSAQLVGYSLATLVMDKVLPQSVTLDYLVRTPKRHDLKYVPRSTTVDMNDINMFLFRFARAVHSWHVACKTGSFLPANPDDWHCSSKFCGYFDRCPAAKRPKQISLVQIGNNGATANTI